MAIKNFKAWEKPKVNSATDLVEEEDMIYLKILLEKSLSMQNFLISEDNCRKISQEMGVAYA